MGTCAIVSFRLRLTDGVSVVAATWERVLSDLGWRTVTVAGEGPVDRVVPGLALDAAHPPDIAAVQDALVDADVVLVENLLTIPMNLQASRVVAAVLRGRPAVLHHHDPPWQRDRYHHITELPVDDPAWRHVTINRLTQRQLAERGIRAATTIYNGFDTAAPPGDRARTRAALGLEDDRVLVAHPVRAIARKQIPVAVALTEALDGTYWLPGPAEEGYQDELDRILAGARCPVIRVPWPDMADLYAASDLVAFPSTWEGFGNPPIEAAIHRRPAAVGRYPVADELRALGFRWSDPTDPPAVARSLDPGRRDDLDRNREVAARHFSLAVLTERVRDLLDGAGWRP
jgi:glycosyltransferase involved in cell wall biosynthesis